MQMKKKLTRLKLINWHYFNNETILLKNTNLFSGENGAGKSTILDALQLVLTTNSRRFNLAANADSSRTLKSYVRGKTGEEGNEYLRKKAVISYIALEVYEESRQRYFVIGAKFDSPDAESSVKTKWFCEECRLEALSFLVDNKPARDEQFKNNGKKISFIPQSSMARDKFKRRLGNLNDKFFEILPKSIAFKPMKNVKSFVSQFILPERTIDIDVLRENIRSLKEMQGVVEEVRKHIVSLEEIQNLYNDIMRIDEQITVTDIIVKLADLYNKRETFSQRKEELQKAEIQFSTYQRENERLTEEIESLNERYTALIVSLEQGQTAQLIKDIKNELKNKERDKNSFSKKFETLKGQLNRVKTAQKQVLQVFNADCYDMDRFIDAEVSVEEKNSFIIEVENSFSKSKKEINNSIYSLRTEIDALKNTLIRLDNEINKLQENKITYPKNTTLLQAEIKKEFKARGILSDVYIFSDLLEISDSKWQNTVEGYLNTQRFHIIVEPQYYNIAAEVYDKCKNRIHTAAVVNTSKIRTDLTIHENSLASVVESKNRYAMAYAYYLLGTVAMCDSVGELKQHETAITQSCMLYKGHTLRKINPEVYKMPYIGKYALAEQLKIKQKEYDEKTGKKRELELSKRKYDAAFAALEDCNFEIMKSVLSSPLDLRRISDEISGLKAELNEAESDMNYIGLQMESEELKSRINTLQDKLGNTRQTIGKEEEKIDHIKRDLSELENSISYAGSSLEELSEKFASAYAEAERRFAEHQKTKAFSTIFENCDQRRKGLNTQKEDKELQLRLKQQNFKDGELGTGLEVMSEYKKEYDNLAKNDLIGYEEKLCKMKENCETEFRESFLAKMRENIENAISLFKELNKTLKPIYYGNDSYRFDYSPAKNRKRLYEMITSEFNLAGFNLMSEQFDAEYHDEMEELFSKLTESSENGEEVISEYTDYRSYLDYDIEIISRDGKTQKFSKIYREKSGGETQTPYYVAIAASFTQLYSVGETIKVIMLDEAFDKMDEERIKQMLEFFKLQDFQVILAAPTSRLELIGEQSDNIVMIYTDGSHNSFTEGISYDEL